MRVLLDTVTFVLAVNSPERLSRRARSILEAAGEVRELSSVSVTEIAIKNSNGKLEFSKVNVSAGVADLELRYLPFTAEHALRLFELPMHHRDPFDRQLIAQAGCEEIPIVTNDRLFGLYRDIEIIW